MFYLEP
ncbi:hypothetical protein CGLO_12497 [Colletotrichum gloeosporioides Cg-14]|nr:hypothetical protein CGLO_12497 [Colletotrichum gloeosporioides Cg-14]